MNGTPQPLSASTPTPAPARVRRPHGDHDPFLEQLTKMLADGQKQTAEAMDRLGLECRDGFASVRGELSGVRTDLAAQRLVPDLLRLGAIGMIVTVALVAIVGGAGAAIQVTDWFSASVAP